MPDEDLQEFVGEDPGELNLGLPIERPPRALVGGPDDKPRKPPLIPPIPEPQLDPEPIPTDDPQYVIELLDQQTIELIIQLDSHCCYLQTVIYDQLVERLEYLSEQFMLLTSELMRTHDETISSMQAWLREVLDSFESRITTAVSEMVVVDGLKGLTQYFITNEGDQINVTGDSYSSVGDGDINAGDVTNINVATSVLGDDDNNVTGLPSGNGVSVAVDGVVVGPATATALSLAEAQAIVNNVQDPQLANAVAVIIENERVAGEVSKREDTAKPISLAEDDPTSPTDWIPWQFYNDNRSWKTLAKAWHGDANKIYKESRSAEEAVRGVSELQDQMASQSSESEQ